MLFQFWTHLLDSVSVKTVGLFLFFAIFVSQVSFVVRFLLWLAVLFPAQSRYANTKRSTVHEAGHLWSASYLFIRVEKFWPDSVKSSVLAWVSTVRNFKIFNEIIVSFTTLCIWKIASFLLEEFISLIVVNDFLRIESGCADSLFNLGIRTLLLSNEYGSSTRKEIELLRAASTICHVRILCVISVTLCD